MKISPVSPPGQKLIGLSSQQRHAETRYCSSLISLGMCNPFRAVWQWILNFFCCCKEKGLTAAERKAELKKFKNFVRDHWNQEGYSYIKAWTQLDPINRQALIEKSLAALRQKASQSEFKYTDNELFNGAVEFASDPLSAKCDVRILVMNQESYPTCAQELLFGLIDQASEGTLQ